MNFLYCTNVKSETFEASLPEHPAATDVLRIFFGHGHSAVDDQKLSLLVNEKAAPFNVEMLSAQNVTIVYNDIVAPNNAVGFKTADGIFYYFHTDERVHEYTPHVHALCKQANGELWIPLDNPERYKGHYDNPKKETQAKKFVMENCADLMKQWNKITSGAGL